MRSDPPQPHAESTWFGEIGSPLVRRTISEIAHYFRFSDVFHFTRLHKVFYGLSPSVVRKLSNINYSEMKQNTIFEEVIKKSLFGGLFIISKDEQDF